jgi:porin
MAAILCTFLAALQDPPAPEEEKPSYGITGDWNGTRPRWAERGVTLTLNAVYTFQVVAAGGIDDLRLEETSSEDDDGHVGSFDLGLEVDTGKAGLWSGGTFNFRLEGRVGRSVVERAGTVSVVNIDAVFPNVVDRFDEEALAITTLTLSQDLGAGISIFAGLVNASQGDANEIGGNALSPDHFLNSAMLYSLVEDATVPHVALGGGVEWTPADWLTASAMVFGTEETAGDNPFDHTDGGSTFSTEWTVSYELGGRGGAQTAGFLYGTDADRINIAADPRLVLARLLLGLPPPTTSDPTWSFYWNGHQYISGDAEGGWGVFARAGFSDGDPNPVAWNLAAGLGGRGTFPDRDEDAWGAGLFLLELSDEDLLQALNLDHEGGLEAYYTLSITSGLRLTFDLQFIHSAVEPVDETWLLGLRTTVDF